MLGTFTQKLVHFWKLGTFISQHHSPYFCIKKLKKSNSFHQKTLFIGKCPCPHPKTATLLLIPLHTEYPCANLLYLGISYWHPLTPGDTPPPPFLLTSGLMNAINKIKRRNITIIHSQRYYNNNIILTCSYDNLLFVAGCLDEIFYIKNDNKKRG